MTEERIAKLRDGTFASGQVPAGAAAAHQQVQAGLDSGAFGKTLTSLMPLGRPGLSGSLRWSGLAPLPMLMDMKPTGMRQIHRDSRGRTWSVVVVPIVQADNEDAEFWRTLTPEQRVVAVHSCLESALKAQGKTRVPRLRRVARVVKR